MSCELSRVETDRTATGEGTGTAYERPTVVSRVEIAGLMAAVTTHS